MTKKKWLRIGDDKPSSASFSRSISKDQLGNPPKVGKLPVEGGFGLMWVRPTPDPDRESAIAPRGRRQRWIASHRRWMISTRAINALKRITKTAMIWAVNGRKPMTTEQAVATGTELFKDFNRIMRRRGLGVRIEFKTATDVRLKQLWPGAGPEALRILTGPDDYERGSEGWCGPLLENMLLVAVTPISEGGLRKLSKLEWDAKLRHTKEGQAFQDAASTQTEIEFSNEVEQRREDIKNVWEKQVGEEMQRSEILRMIFPPKNGEDGN